MKIKIKVTKEVLEASKFCSTSICFVSQNCAIAVACREVFPDCAVYPPGGNPSNWVIDLHSGLPQIPLPKVAGEFAMQFDRTANNLRPQMQPISFEIDVPDSVVQKIGLNEIYKILSESKTLEHVVEEIPVEKLA